MSRLQNGIFQEKTSQNHPQPLPRLLQALPMFKISKNAIYIKFEKFKFHYVRMKWHFTNANSRSKPYIEIMVK